MSGAEANADQVLDQEEDVIAYLSSFPPGYRFNPTEQELIETYLLNKINKKSLPAHRIKDVNFYDHNPWDLTEDFTSYGEEEFYFFTPRSRKYKNGSRPSRSAGDGYWKATGADRPIMDHEDRIIGFRKALVFYLGKAPNGSKTHWMMHEYRIPNEDDDSSAEKKASTGSEGTICDGRGSSSRSQNAMVFDEGKAPSKYKTKWMMHGNTVEGGDNRLKRKSTTDDMLLNEWVISKIYKKGEQKTGKVAERQETGNVAEDQRTGIVVNEDVDQSGMNNHDFLTKGRRHVHHDQFGTTGSGYMVTGGQYLAESSTAPDEVSRRREGHRQYETTGRESHHQSGTIRTQDMLTGLEYGTTGSGYMIPGGEYLAQSVTGPDDVSRRREGKHYYGTTGRESHHQPGTIQLQDMVKAQKYRTTASGYKTYREYLAQSVTGPEDVSRTRGGHHQYETNGGQYTMTGLEYGATGGGYMIMNRDYLAGSVTGPQDVARRREDQYHYGTTGRESQHQSGTIERLVMIAGRECPSQFVPGSEDLLKTGAETSGNTGRGNQHQSGTIEKQVMIAGRECPSQFVPGSEDMLKTGVETSGSTNMNPTMQDHHQTETCGDAFEFINFNIDECIDYSYRYLLEDPKPPNL